MSLTLLDPGNGIFAIPRTSQASYKCPDIVLADSETGMGTGNQFQVIQMNQLEMKTHPDSMPKL